MVALSRTIRTIGRIFCHLLPLQKKKRKKKKERKKERKESPFQA
jgi:hypothetical protein